MHFFGSRYNLVSTQCRPQRYSEPIWYLRLIHPRICGTIFTPGSLNPSTHSRMGLLELGILAFVVYYYWFRLLGSPSISEGRYETALIRHPIRRSDSTSVQPLENPTAILTLEDVQGREDQVEPQESDVDEVLVEDPSNAVRDDLASAMEEIRETYALGSFAFRKSYPGAPGPELQIKTFGVLGLPIRAEEARSIASFCRNTATQEQRGATESNNMQDTCEIVASKVRFDSPAWSTFMLRIENEVRACMGIKFRSIQLRSHKLYVCGPGSYIYPVDDSRRPSGALVTMVIILPSRFTGGAMQLSDGKVSIRFDSSASTEPETSVFAWYNDVILEAEPIKQGYCVALSLNFICPQAMTRPKTPSSSSFHALRHILLSWKKRPEENPTKLIILLDYSYSQEGLRRCALGESDIHLTVMLDMLARQHGFRIVLANMDCCFGERTTPYESQDNRSELDVGGRQGAPSLSVNAMHRPERYIWIADVVDLQGNSVTKGISCDNDEEMVPAQFYEAVELGERDMQTNSDSNEPRFVQRSVLMIWPNAHSCDVEFGEDKALEVIQKAKGLKPTILERQLMEYLFVKAQSGRISLASLCKSVCSAAVVWNDVELWQRAFTCCSAGLCVDVPGLDIFLTSISRFGFERLESRITTILMKEESNTERYAFISQLQQASVGSGIQIPSAWFADQSRAMAEGLKKPMGHESALLLGIAREQGGLSFLESVIIPQVSSLADPEFLVTFAGQIYTQYGSATPSTLVNAPYKRIITNLLSTAISRIEFFGPEELKQSRPRLLMSHLNPTQPATVAVVHRFFVVSLETSNPLLTNELVKRLTSQTALVPTIAQPARSLVTLLVPLFCDTCRARSADALPIPGISQLCQAVFWLYMDPLVDLKPSTQDWSSAIELLVLGGDVGMFGRAVPVPLLSLVASSALVDFAAQLHHNESIFTQEGHKQLLGSIVYELLSSAIPRVDFFAPTVASPSLDDNVADQNPYVEAATQCIDLCVYTGHVPLVEKIAERVSFTSNVDSKEAYLRAKFVILPSILSIYKLLPLSSPSLLAGLAKMQGAYIEGFIRFFNEIQPTREDWPDIMDILGEGSETNVMENILLPKLRSTQLSKRFSQELIRWLECNKNFILGNSDSAEVFAAVTAELLQQIILQLDLSRPERGYPPNNPDGVGALILRVMRVLEICFNTGHHSLSIKLFNRLRESHPLRKPDITKVYIPLVKELSAFCQRRNFSLAHKSLRPLCRMILMAYVKTVLGSKPERPQVLLDSVMRMPWCDCEHCSEVVGFLTDPGPTSAELMLSYIGAVPGKHVASQIRQNSRGLATISIVTTTRPYSIIVFKSADLQPNAIQRWKRNQTDFIGLLESLKLWPNSPKLERIMGKQFDSFINRIGFEPK